MFEARTRVGSFGCALLLVVGPPALVACGGGGPGGGKLVPAPEPAPPPRIEVSIPDANLRAEIERVLEEPAGAVIYRSEMAGIESLTARRSSIRNLEGLQFATAMAILDLGENEVTDLTPLTTLHLSGNDVSDLTSLKDLTSLTNLSLSRNNISDVTPLTGLTALEVLRLSNNSVSELAPLVENQGLGEGDKIDVRQNPLSAASLDEHIPALQQRGANVTYDRPGETN